MRSFLVIAPCELERYACSAIVEVSYIWSLHLVDWCELEWHVHSAAAEWSGSFGDVGPSVSIPVSHDSLYLPVFLSNRGEWFALRPPLSYRSKKFSGFFFSMFNLLLLWGPNGNFYAPYMQSQKPSSSLFLGGVALVQRPVPGCLSRDSMRTEEESI